MSIGIGGGCVCGDNCCMGHDFTRSDLPNPPLTEEQWKVIEDCAREIGYRAGLEINRLFRKAHNMDDFCASMAEPADAVVSKTTGKP